MTLPAEEAAATVVTADILRTELQMLRGEFRSEMAQDRAEMWRAFWIFGTGIVAALGVIVAVANALG